MKNKLYLISLISLLAIGGCKGNTSSSINENSVDISSSSISSISSSINNKEADILIEYYFSNGKLVNKNKTKGIVGESYSINTPSLDFMKPNYEKVDFTLTEDGFYQKVIYDYSLEPIKEVNVLNKIKFVKNSHDKLVSNGYCSKLIDTTNIKEEDMYKVIEGELNER